MKKYIILILTILSLIFINKIAFANKEFNKQTLPMQDKIEKEQDNNKTNDIAKEKEFAKYADYLDDMRQGKKCEGYDFDPEKIVLIKIVNPEYYIELSNGKKFRIEAWMGDCGSIDLKGKDGYKQLPDSCKILIGSTCISPPPSNCKKLIGTTCWDEKVKQDYQVFQWECTNKGCERMTNFTEYDLDFFEE